jgi:hypothetical protein
MAANGNHGNGHGLPLQLKYLLGGAGVLQVVLTTVGVHNGGISALVINHRLLTIGGFGAVLVAIAIGAAVLLMGTDHPVIGEALTIIGTILLFIGIGVAGYAALVAPAVAKAPDIDASLSRSSGEFVLTAHVKASGIPESEPYWIEVDAREYVAGSNGGKYTPLGTPLYQNQLGADSLGNVESTLTIPLPVGAYGVVSVEGWNGAHAGPCGSLTIEGGANLTKMPAVKPGERRRSALKTTQTLLEEHGRSGCLVMRVPPRPAVVQHHSIAPKDSGPD